MRRLYVAIFLVAALTGAVAVPVLGLHTHVVAEWNHGLGDGNDNDFWVNPYTTNTLGHTHAQQLELRADGHFDPYFVIGCGGCVSLSKIWDTGGRAECLYFSGHSTSGSHALNFHWHYHHFDC